MLTFVGSCSVSITKNDTYESKVKNGNLKKWLYFRQEDLQRDIN